MNPHGGKGKENYALRSSGVRAGTGLPKLPLDSSSQNSCVSIIKRIFGRFRAITTLLFL
jgi:hypothetical protein